MLVNYVVFLLCYFWHLAFFLTFAHPADGFPRPSNTNIINVLGDLSVYFIYSGIVKWRQGTLVCAVPPSKCISSCNFVLMNVVFVLTNEVYIWNAEACNSRAYLCTSYCLGYTHGKFVPMYVCVTDHQTQMKHTNTHTECSRDSSILFR